MEILSITNVLSPHPGKGLEISFRKKIKNKPQSQHKNDPSPLAGPIADNKVPICCSWDGVNELEERGVQESRLEKSNKGWGERGISLWSDCDHLLQQLWAGNRGREREPGAPGAGKSLEELLEGILSDPIKAMRSLGTNLLPSPSPVLFSQN